MPEKEKKKVGWILLSIFRNPRSSLEAGTASEAAVGSLGGCRGRRGDPRAASPGDPRRPEQGKRRLKDAAAQAAAERDLTRIEARGGAGPEDAAEAGRTSVPIA